MRGSYRFPLKSAVPTDTLGSSVINVPHQNGIFVTKNETTFITNANNHPKSIVYLRMYS